MTKRTISQKWIDEQVEKQNKKNKKIDSVMELAVNNMTDEELRQRYNLSIDEYDKLFNDGIYENLEMCDELKPIDCHLDITKKYEQCSKTQCIALQKLHCIISHFEINN